MSTYAKEKKTIESQRKKLHEKVNVIKVYFLAFQ